MLDCGRLPSKKKIGTIGGNKATPVPREKKVGGGQA